MTRTRSSLFIAASLPLSHDLNKLLFEISFSQEALPHGRPARLDFTLRRLIETCKRCSTPRFADLECISARVLSRRRATSAERLGCGALELVAAAEQIAARRAVSRASGGDAPAKARNSPFSNNPNLKPPLKGLVASAARFLPRRPLWAGHFAEIRVNGVSSTLTAAFVFRKCFGGCQTSRGKTSANQNSQPYASRRVAITERQRKANASLQLGAARLVRSIFSARVVRSRFAIRA